MRKHTPGPWSFPSGTDELHDSDGDVLAKVSFSHCGLNERENANLISAAPELLEALESASNQLTSDGHYPLLVAILDRVIAKATGGDK